MKPVEHWFDQMRQIWLSQEPDKITALLAKSFIYYESSFKSPLTRASDVADAWQAIKEDKIIESKEPRAKSAGHSEQSKLQLLV